MNNTSRVACDGGYFLFGADVFDEDCSFRKNNHSLHHLIMQHVEIPSIRWDYAVIDGPRKHSKQKGTARRLD